MKALLLTCLVLAFRIDAGACIPGAQAADIKIDLGKNAEVWFSRRPYRAHCGLVACAAGGFGL